jgi:hypothetical protein
LSTPFKHAIIQSNEKASVQTGFHRDQVTYPRPAYAAVEVYFMTLIEEILDKVQFQAVEGQEKAVLDRSDWDELVVILKQLDVKADDKGYFIENTTIERITLAPEEALPPGNDGLSLLTQVYEGLSPEEIDEIEQIALDRSRFFTDREE